MTNERSGPRSPRRVAIGASLMCMGVIGATTGATLAQGAPAKPAAKPVVGSDIGALSVTAISNGVRVPLYSHTGEDVESRVPYSIATLGTGGIGDALTSVFFPGDTGAHGGDTLNLLGIKGLPVSVAQMLNDPEIAHAQTGVGKPMVDLSHPGVTMKASASATHVSAISSAGGDGVPVVGPIVGSTETNSDVLITGPRTVTINATSTAHNISVAKVVKIGAVTSTVHAVEDGRHAPVGSAKTVVSGVTIAGVAVTVDNKGVHVPGKALPLVGNTAAKVVNTALKGAGIKLQVTNVKRHIHGQHAVLDSGALIVNFGNTDYTGNDNDTGKLLIIGGTSIDATVHHGYTTPPIKPTKTPKPTPTKAHTGGGGGGVSSGGGGSGGSSGVIPPGDNPPVDTGTGDGGAVTGGSSPVLAGNSVALPGGLSIWWAIVGLAGAGLFAVGMRRLPDQVLQQAGVTCNLEE